MFANPISVTLQVSRIPLVALGLAGSVLAGQGVTWALPQQEVSEISQMGMAQGRSAEEMRKLIDHAERLEARGLPPEALLDKIKEGLAKGVKTDRMDPVLTNMATNLETADGLLKQAAPSRSVRRAARARSRCCRRLSRVGLVPMKCAPCARPREIRKCAPSNWPMERRGWRS